jgi:YegS/Rv2252/BmrU family lipid kinase
MRKYKIIVNPVSGRGSAKLAVPLIEKLLTENGLDFDIVLTERPWHAAELAHEASAAGYSTVVSAGGDGTANEVLNGLMRAKETGSGSAAMGVLCVGRGNDFAFGMGIPHDLPAACRLLSENTKRTIDVGKVTGGLYPNGRFFGNGVGIGFDAIVGFEALKMKRLHGFLSYMVAALKTIFLYFHAPLVRIEFNGQSTEQPSLLISIMNGRRMGGGFLMAPQAEPDDGLFDLCIVGEATRRHMVTLFLRFIKGTQASDKAIHTARTRQIAVTAVDGVLPAHADGETLCTEGNRLVMELLPNQIEIVSSVSRC